MLSRWTARVSNTTLESETAMTADKGAMGADSKIRAPGRRRGIWFFVYGGISLVFAAGYLPKVSRGLPYFGQVSGAATCQ